jgi:hypothetical protein
MPPEQNCREELEKYNQPAKLWSSQLCGVFKDVVHFFRLPLLQLQNPSIAIDL